MEKKNKDGGKLAGILLTVTLVACCIALFIMSEQGSKLIGSFGAAGKDALAASQTDETPVLSREAFISSAAKNGLEAKLNEKSASERIAIYGIEEYQNCQGELILSLSNGAVTAFTLRFKMPHCQSGDDDQASESRKLLLEQYKKAYSEYMNWFPKVYAPLAFALDDLGKLSYAHVDASVNNLKNALGEDTQAIEMEKEFRQLISLTDSDGLCDVSVSLEKAE